MECVKCGGKCKVVQTHKSSEVKIEKVAMAAGADKDKKTTLSDYEIVQKDVVDSTPIVKRKLKCLECGCYFWTKETFDGYTEATIRNGVMSKIQERMANLKPEDFKDCVFSIPPEVQPELKIKLKGIRGGE